MELESNAIEFSKKLDPTLNTLLFGHGMAIRALICVLRDGRIKNINTFKVKNNQLIQVSTS